ncbi:MAG TPA: DUF4468 domain-containing protein [Bacteroidales bacterium]|nr:DUF4468 domain-containing protein [Bacteroidales bacterium]
MRKIILINMFFAIVFLQNINLKAQVPVDPDTKKIIYQEVVQQDGIKDTLYNRAISWINKFFENPQGITKVREPENGKIIGTYRMRMQDTLLDGSKTLSNVIVVCTFTIEAKDGRYRYTLDDFYVPGTSKIPLEKWLDKTDQYYSPKYEDYLKQVDQYVNRFITSLKEGMQPPIIKVDEW